MNPVITMQIVLGLAVLTFSLWERSRARRKLSRVKKELAACQATLHQFMKESEATFSELSRLVDRGRSLGSMGTRAPDRSRISITEAPTDPNVAAVAMTEPELAVSSRKKTDKKVQVLKLADRGAGIAEIAGQLMIPQGEIELILNLSRQA